MLSSSSWQRKSAGAESCAAQQPAGVAGPARCLLHHPDAPAIKAPRLRPASCLYIQASTHRTAQCRRNGASRPSASVSAAERCPHRARGIPFSLIPSLQYFYGASAARVSVRLCIAPVCFPAPFALFYTVVRQSALRRFLLSFI